MQRDIYTSSDDSSCETDYSPRLNIVKDYLLLEQRADVGSINLRRNIDVRRVSIENHTPFDLAIAIHPYRYGDAPKQINFHAAAGSVRWVGVNPPGDQQFLWVFMDGQPINDPHFLDYHENQYVIHAGNFGDAAQGISPYNPAHNESTEFPNPAWPKWVWVKGYRQPSI